MGLLGIVLGLALLIWLAYRGWSVLLVGPLVALSGEPLVAYWTQTFMGGAARFVAQFFPLFLLGALFGKLVDDTVSALERDPDAYLRDHPFAAPGLGLIAASVMLGFGLWWLGRIYPTRSGRLYRPASRQ